MKGGKGGQGRKRSGVRVSEKTKKARGHGKKQISGRDRLALPRKEVRTTTRLGANRVEDDA